MQVEDFLLESARRFPEKTALVCEGERLGYREIDDRTNALAHALVEAGVERGDRVAVFLENSVTAAVSIFAILKAGGVFVVVNPTTKADKLAYVLEDCGVKTLITHGRKRKAVAGALDRATGIERVLVDGDPPEEIAERCPEVLPLREEMARHAERAEPPPRRCIDVDLAALIYTSGSSGVAKGVMVTHGNVVAAATSITTYLENTPEDVILSVLPLSFDYGLYQLLMGFFVGGTVVLERSFAYPGAILERIVEERVTGFPLLPTISAMLLQMDLSRHDFSSLRYLTNTGAALPVSHIQELRAAFPGVRLYSMYGLTECKRVSYLDPAELDRIPSSVGKAMPNTEVFVVDEDGMVLGPGETGELVVRGANVMKGYWGKPEATAEVLKPGKLPGERLLYTGDLFRTDEDGFLYFVGRKDDVLKSRGEKVSPREVENVLHELEGVAEAAVVGVPDDLLGQSIKAVVRVADGHDLTERRVLKFCSDHLESFLVPSIVEFVDEFPRTTSGKIDKKEL